MPLSRVLVIQPENGLCNRLRAFDSALQLAAEYGFGVVLSWNLGAGMNCPFERLFEIPDRVARVWTWSSFSRIDRLLLRAVRLAIRVTGGAILDQAGVGRVLAGEVSIGSLAARHDRLFLRTASRFYGSERPYHGWRARSHILAQVTRLVEQAGEGTVVGVHIRRGDHRIARMRSPIDAFILRMEQAVEEDADVRFIVATDDPSEAETLKGRFGARILCHPKRSVARSNPEAAEDALVDLLALASTRRVIGSAGSSFSETAAEWGGIPLEVAC